MQSNPIQMLFNEVGDRALLSGGEFKDFQGPVE